jgi:hypothetical protein
MRIDITMPQMGESIAEGTITKWLKKVGDTVEKTISVMGNPLTNLRLQPWLEEGSVISAPEGYTAKGQGRNHIGYNFKDASSKSVTIKIKPGREPGLKK